MADYYSPNQIVNGVKNMGPTVTGGPASVAAATGGGTSTGTGGASTGGSNGSGSVYAGNTTSSTTVLPSWMNDAGQAAVAKAKGITYTPYTGDRVAGTTADQNAAYGGIKSLADANATAGAAQGAQQGIYGYATAPASTVSTGTVVNENGPLGTIASYMNPYTGAVLDPTLEAIYEAAGKQRNTIGASATSSGAFGDARQGVLESTLGKNTMSAAGNATNQAYSDAYNQAMGLRTSDANRFLTADTTNASLNETALQRLLTGSQAYQQSASQEQQDALTRINALLSSGTAQQQQTQNVDDAALAARNEAQQAQFDQLNALVSTLSGVPTQSTTNTTTPTQKSNNTSTNNLISSIASIVGALV
jgi:hypothetical protein